MSLKNCPFCDGTASLTGGIRGSDHIFYVQCNECGAIGEKFALKFEGEARESASDAWNERK